jgi:hypothetical protein
MDSGSAFVKRLRVKRLKWAKRNSDGYHYVNCGVLIRNGPQSIGIKVNSTRLQDDQDG